MTGLDIFDAGLVEPTRWKGLPAWTCRLCDYSRPDTPRDEVLEHFESLARLEATLPKDRRPHVDALLEAGLTERPAANRVRTSLVDERGDPLYIEEA